MQTFVIGGVGRQGMPRSYFSILFYISLGHGYIHNAWPKRQISNLRNGSESRFIYSLLVTPIYEIIIFNIIQDPMSPNSCILNRLVYTILFKNIIHSQEKSSEVNCHMHVVDTSIQQKKMEVA